MSKEELKTVENTFYNNIKKYIPDFQISATNNALVIFIKSCASLIYALVKKSDKYTSTLTAINDGNLDYRSAFYGIKRREATKSQGIIVGTGTLGTVIPQGTFFIDGNYISLEDSVIESKEVIGSMNIDANKLGVWNIPNNYIPLGYELDIIINSQAYHGSVTKSESNSLEIQLETSPEAGSNYNASTTLEVALIRIESLVEGLNQNLEPNIEFDFNQIIDGLNKKLNVSPQGVLGGQDVESDVSMSKRWALQRAGYVTSTSYDGIQLHFLTNIPDATRVFPFRRTADEPAKIYTIYENRASILSTADDIIIQKNLYNEITNIGASVDVDVLFPDLELMPIDIAYDTIIPSTIEMQVAIKNTIDLFFRNENSVGKNFLKNDLLLYLLANCIDANNQSLQSINLIVEDKNITNSQLAVANYVN